MRRAWLAWLWVTFFLVVYVAAALVELRVVETSVRLEAGYAAHVNVVRLDNDPLLMHLVLPEPRPPGSAIRLRAKAGLQSAIYDAEPTSAHGTIDRVLSSNISIAPGVWRWPPPAELPTIVLHPGVTELTIEVVSVEAPLAGQSARLLIYPPLGLKMSKKDIGWVKILWFGGFWPIMVVIQLVWAALIWRV